LSEASWYVHGNSGSLVFLPIMEQNKTHALHSTYAPCVCQHVLCLLLTAVKFNSLDI
jgi:hypothetical protein